MIIQAPHIAGAMPDHIAVSDFVGVLCLRVVQVPRAYVWTGDPDLPEVSVQFIRVDAQSNGLHRHANECALTGGAQEVAAVGPRVQDRDGLGSVLP